MNAHKPRYDPVESKVHVAGNLGAFQVSLASVFVVVTITSLVLAAFIGIGQVLGMSTAEVLAVGLGQLIFTVPTLVVWAIGWSMAFRCRQQYPLPAKLTMIGLGGLMLGSLMPLLRIMLMFRMPLGDAQSILALMGILQTLLNTGCWILIIGAIFAQRTPFETGVGQHGP